jgi:hypothetical protein
MLPINRPSLFIAMRGNEDNTFTNCIFEGFYNFESRVSALNTNPSVVSIHGIIPTNVVFKNCVFNANNFDDQIISNGTLAPVLGAPLTQGANNQVAGTFIDCIVDDPLFIDRQNGNYHLVQNSPCIDAGTFVPLVDDFEGNLRPKGIGYDIGAYEFQGTTTSIYSNELIKLISIYPNPTNGLVNIKIQNQAIQHIKLYDLKGMLIKESSESQFDVSGYMNGTYLIRVQTEKGSYIYKLIKQ